jgi:phosphatidylglycerol lysyltransferase
MNFIIESQPLWLALLMGSVLLRRARALDLLAALGRLEEGGRALALLVAGLGFLHLLQINLLGLPWLEEQQLLFGHFLPFASNAGAPATGIFAGCALLLLGRGLWRRKRAAWWVTLFTLGLAVFSSLLDYTPGLQTWLGAGLIASLLLLGSQFSRPSDALAVRRGLLLLVLGVVIFALLGTSLLPASRGWGEVLAIGMGLTGLWLLNCPIQMRKPATPAERLQAQKIIEAYGCSSNARLVLLDDKVFFFSPGGSVIGFAVRGRTAVTLGDPVGPLEDAQPAITAFKTFCQHRDWLPVFCLTTPRLLEIYRAAGFQAFRLGHEGILDLESFSLTGRANKSFRKRFNRALSSGYRVEIYQPPISEALLAEIRSVSDEWLTMTRGKEKGFFLGWFDDDYLRSGALALVRTPEGTVSAFANIVPEYQLNEVTIDLMRRRRTILSGTVDFLLVSLFFWAKEQGYATFNLGLSPLANVGTQPGDPPIEHVIHQVFEHGNWFYDFKGLHDFKSKFQLSWTPQYLVYPGAGSLPSVFSALVRANARGWYVPWEYFRRRRYD